MNRLILDRFGPWIMNRARRLIEPFDDGFQLSDLPGVIQTIASMVADLRTDDEQQRKRLEFIMICFVVDHTEVWLDSIIDAGVKMLAAGFLGQPIDSAPSSDDWKFLERLEEPVEIADVVISSTSADPSGVESSCSNCGGPIEEADHLDVNGRLFCGQDECDRLGGELAIEVVDAGDLVETVDPKAIATEIVGKIVEIEESIKED